MLAKLRALPIPAADRADYNHAYLLFEKRLELDREDLAVVAATGAHPTSGPMAAKEIPPLSYEVWGAFGSLGIQECGLMIPG
jgi:hypothetical protein